MLQIQHAWSVPSQGQLFPISDTAPAPPAPAEAHAPMDTAPAAPAAAPAGRKLRPTISEAPTCVLRLANMATREDLVDQDTYQDILDDVAGALYTSAFQDFERQT